MAPPQYFREMWGASVLGRLDLSYLVKTTDPQVILKAQNDPQVCRGEKAGRGGGEAGGWGRAGVAWEFSGRANGLGPWEQARSRNS